MVGTSTTARDWQWLDDIMDEDAPAAPSTQRNSRMHVSYACQRGVSRPRRGSRAGRGCGEGGDVAPAQQTQGGATIPSTMSSPSQQAFLDGLSNPGFQQMISDIMLEGGNGYRPGTQFDGSSVHLDLNEPVFGPSHLFMALGGTPPSASHLPGASWTYHLWSLRICRLLQCHLHRLSSQMSQQHRGGPAELHVVEGAAPEAICSSLIPYNLFNTTTNPWQGLTDFIEMTNGAI
ncbi:hypothetical protein PIB30_053487 [Stylosanthes scabra]|uniref:Uncharacterized protein n=1 Tax=Stylosanthes scabra TaxID=79078 RepID=A0ABU6YJ00_9FABA|nr:hypothetical protein [Stylosanthes scabra]